MLRKYYMMYIGRRGTQEQTIPRQARYLARRERGAGAPGYIYARGELEAGAAELEAGQLRAGGCKLIGDTLELNQYRSETGNYQGTKILTIIRIKH